MIVESISRFFLNQFKDTIIYVENKIKSEII